MATDSVVRRVAQKELRLFFCSPVAWLFLGLFSAITLFVFFWVEAFFARNVADLRPLFEWLPVLLIFLCSALTMRMWSDEHRYGTLEHILTQPQGLWRFVLGKFQACCALLLIALVCTAPLPLTVALIADLDWGPVIGGYVATALLGGAYISIGLYVSARTDNTIVSLIGSVTLCGLFYFLGSDTLTDFFSDRIGETLRLLAAGARFESIIRGVLDAADLVYYLSLTVIFLSLNLYALERERWARAISTARHRRWQLATALFVINIILANLWLAKMPAVRLDLTEGRQYTISQPTLEMISQLHEPLLIRGYFSAKTHPLLSPLVPRLRDLISEYERIGAGRIRTEIVDPARQPQLEREANERFGIISTAFQVADRYQSALVNSYFNVLVQYGDQYEVLEFADLIEVKTAGTQNPEVMLRNPEFDITRAIARVLHRYQSGGDLFEAIAEPVELIGYVSADGVLPDVVREYKRLVEAHTAEIEERSGGKFSTRFIEPEARGGVVAGQIREKWGFKPMVARLGDEQQFYFYLTLADGRQLVQLPINSFETAGFEAALQAGLQRFARGFTRNIALVVPKVHEQMAKYRLGPPTFANLQAAIGKDYNLLLEDIEDGSVTEHADLLVVAGPHHLGPKALFAIDQFVMRGGTLLLATSPYSAEISGGEIRMQPWRSGLEEWLAHHGIEIGEALVLDTQNAPFPAPVVRRSGDQEFREAQMIDYPFFIDLRPGGLQEHPVTRNLPQLTMAWPSPIEVERRESRRASVLLRSSPDSWLSTDLDVVPRMDSSGTGGFAPGAARAAQTLGVALRGRFTSWFAERAAPPGVGAATVLERSPQSARMVLFSSNDFLDDQILRAVVSASGTQYLGPLELVLNTLDWALEDDKLLQIRSRGHFNRTLPPMQRTGQEILEYANYGISLLLLALIAAAAWLGRRYRLRGHARGLAP